ncbi:MAG: CmcJ/NvfI family oxidoreductase [Alphaproteobacteria bacterium]|jgi:hypothetical protein
MATVLEENENTVRATVQFSVNNGVTPVSMVQDAGQGSDTRTGAYEDREISIFDGRPIAEQLDLDRNGFILRKFNTSVTDFFDDEHVKSIYYPEMEEIVKKETGCSEVLVFDHTIRIDDSDLAQTRKVRNPVKNMHNDFTRNSAPQRVRDLLPSNEAEAKLNKRYGSMNVWRPLVGPVETAPLAVCGWDTLREKDLLVAERRYQDRLGGVLHLTYNPDQRWYYFPKMTRDEVVLLKCFDSLEDGTAKWTCHGSFQPPNIPPSATPRQSIEIRTLYFFDD